jgi:hypothetical protein
VVMVDTRSMYRSGLRHIRVPCPLHRVASYSFVLVDFPGAVISNQRPFLAVYIEIISPCSISLSTHVAPVRPPAVTTACQTPTGGLSPDVRYYDGQCTAHGYQLFPRAHQSPHPFLQFALFRTAPAGARPWTRRSQEPARRDASSGLQGDHLRLPPCSIG